MNMCSYLLMAHWRKRCLPHAGRREVQGISKRPESAEGRSAECAALQSSSGADLAQQGPSYLPSKILQHLQHATILLLSLWVLTFLRRRPEEYVTPACPLTIWCLFGIICCHEDVKGANSHVTRGSNHTEDKGSFDANADCGLPAVSWGR